MTVAIAAASALIDSIAALTSSGASPSKVNTGFSQSKPAAFDFSSAVTASSGTASGPIGPTKGSLSPDTLNALFAVQSQSPGPSPAPASRSASLKDLFAQLDGNGDGQISKTEFENTLGAGGTNVAKADDVFSKLDKNSDGSVSLGELSSALRGASGRRHHRHGGGPEGQGGTNDPLLKALQGASSSSSTNSDGSTTTSVTYADGSKVTLTAPAASGASSSATSSYNFVEQLIQRQAQALSASATPALSVTA